MKLSIYNSIIEIEGKHTLLFNAFSGNFVVARNRLLKLDDAAMEDISANNPTLFNQLKEGGMLVDDEVDEVALLKKRIIDADNNTNSFILHINPTLDCNFSCWYCYENHVARSRMEPTTVEAVKKYISSVLEDDRIKNFHLGFFGGEPLFHFNSVARPLIKYAADCCKEHNCTFSAHFTTNGALFNDEIIDFLSGFDCGFQITLDGGKVCHDKTRFNHDDTGSYDTIVANIKKLAEAGMSVIVRVNFTSDNVDSVENIFDSFGDVSEESKKFLSFDFQRVWQDRNDRNDDAEVKMTAIRSRFKEAGFMVLANYIPHDVRNSCYGDKLNHVLINYNGDVFGCTARDFTTTNSIGRLNDDGSIAFDHTKVEHRNSSKLSKEVCRRCRIAPLCGGGCKQKASEAHDDDKCSMGYTAAEMDDMILDIFEYSFETDKGVYSKFC